MKRISVVVAIACLSAPGPAPAQQAFEVAVPAEQLDCLVENQEKYLSFPRPVFDFFIELCPAITGEEAARMALNSADGTTRLRNRLLITKGDFRCLLGKIGEHLEASAETEALAETEAPDATEAPDEPSPDEVVFVLDCPE